MNYRLGIFLVFKRTYTGYKGAKSHRILVQATPYPTLICIRNEATDFFSILVYWLFEI